MKTLNIFAAFTIAMSGQYAVWTGYGYEVRYSTNYGASWTASNSGVKNFMDIKMYGNNVYACAIFTKGGLFYSTNRGQTFTGIAAGTTNVYSVTKLGSILYIGGFGNIYKSTDNGTTATLLYNFGVNSGNSGVLAIESYPGTNGDFIWFGTDSTGNTNYYSNNGGSTWTAVSALYSPNYVAINATRMIVGCYGTGIYYGKNVYIT